MLLKGRDGRIAWERLSRLSDPHLLDLIVGLLEHDPNNRYGSVGGGRRVMRHPYFNGVDWKNIYAKPSPLVDRAACIDTSRLQTFTDRRSAMDFISYARGLVQGMPLGPKQHRMGGWIGMVPEPVLEDTTLHPDSDSDEDITAESSDLKQTHDEPVPGSNSSSLALEGADEAPSSQQAGAVPLAALAQESPEHASQYLPSLSTIRHAAGEGSIGASRSMAGAKANLLRQ